MLVASAGTRDAGAIAALEMAVWSLLSGPSILVGPAIVGGAGAVCHVAPSAASVVEAEVEQEGRESAAVTRGQNVVYQLPHDWASAAHVLAPVLDRLDDSSREPQLLVVTADAESAAGAAALIVRLIGARALEAVAATSARRAARLLKARAAQIVTGAPQELLALIQSAALKLEHIRAAVLAWVDELPAGDQASGADALATLMTEIPKDAARVVVASDLTPAVNELVERYARRARRVAPAPAAGHPPRRLEYLTVAAVSRLPALRRLLDELDPPRAVVYARTEESERDARDLLRALGYRGAEGDAVRVARAAGEGELDLLVLYDVPASREELNEAIGASAPRRVIALAQPRQLASVRVLAGEEGAIAPYTFADAGARARSRDEAARAELRGVLASGTFARELLTLEPLLESHDGIEIAAAALRLMQEARLERDAARALAAEPRAGAPAGGAGMTRLFLNIGSIDHARPGDLVGAITNEARITSAQLGKIDVRENHSLVEVASDVADQVIERITGTLIRGRRVVARADQERPGRGGATRPRTGGERGGRPARGDRGDRGERPRRDSRGPRGDRSPRGERGPRVDGQRRERGPRGDGPSLGRRDRSEYDADRAARSGDEE